MKKTRLTILPAALLSLLAVNVSSARADYPGRHPAYLHALSDLRSAHWMLEHRPGDAAVSGQEDVALQQIADAHNDIRKAGIDDGKDIKDHPAVDLPPDHAGRLHRALDLLKKAHEDVKKEEDDPKAVGLRDRSLHRIDDADKAVRAAIKDAELHR